MRELASEGVTRRRRRPWLFLVLVLVASAPFWLLAVATRGQGWFLGLPASAVMIIVPAGVASVLAAGEGGRTGLRILWSGVFDVAGVQPRWWWFVGLGAVPVSALLAWALGARPDAGVDATAWLLAPVYFVVFFLGAIPEEVARDHGIGSETLRNWVNAYRRDHPDELPEISEPERAELARLRKEVRELKAEREFLGKAAAFFAKEFR